MAKIQGITIELSADATGIEQALKDVNKASNATSKELGQINKALKFDPDNAVLLQQKFEVLQDSISNTTTKLDALKQAQNELNARAASGENVSAEQFRALAREIEQTEGILKGFQRQLENVDVKINAEVDTSALDKMKQQLDEVSQKAQEVGGKMKDMGAEMSASLSAPIAALGTGAALAAGQFDNAAGQIQAALGVTADEAERLENAATDVWKAGFGESLEEVSDGLIRVKQNMKEIDGSEIESVTKNALALAKAFDSDVNEVTRAANNLMVNFGVGADEAFDMMAKGAQNGLNFSNELFDNLAEYSGLFANMGYTVEEYFGILQRGSEAGVYNLDYLNDAMKEFQIRAKDGSDGVATAMGDLSQATQDVWDDYYYGKATVKDVATSVINDLMTMEDQTYAGMLGVELFGTKWEDLESKAMYAMLGTTEGLEGAKGAMDALTAAQEQTFGQRWESFARSAAASLEPLGKTLLDLAEQWLPKIISAVESVANWFSNLSPTVQTLSVVFGAVVAAIGPFLVIVGSIISALGAIIPVVTSVVSNMGILGTVLGGLTGPIGIAIAAVTGLIAIGVALYKNWDEVSAFLQGVWQRIADTASSVFNGIIDTVKSVWSAIESATSSAWNTIQNVIDTVLSAIVSVISKYWASIEDGVKKVWDGIKQYFSGVWDLIKNVFVGALAIVLQLLTGKWGEAKKTTEQVWKNIQDALKNIWDGLKKVFSGALEAIGGYIKTTWDNIKSTTTSVFNAVKSTVTSVWEGIKSTVSSVSENILSTVKSAFTSLVSSVSDKMSEVKSTIEKWWSQALTFLKGINLTQIGRDIIQGLINGIRNMTSNAIEAITGVVDGIVDKAKSLLKIKSPSRVMRQIGEWVTEGLGIGIEDKSGEVKNKVAKVANTIVDAFENNLSINTSILDGLNIGEAEKQLLDLQKAAFDYGFLFETLSKEDSSLRFELDRKKVNEDFKYLLDKVEAYDKLREENLANGVSYSVNRTGQEEYATQLSDYYMALLEVDKAEEEHTKNIASLREKQIQSQRDFIKKAIELNAVSLTDAARLYDGLAEEYADDATLQKEFATEAFNIRKDMADKISSINDEYVGKIQAANEKLIADEKAINEAYENSVKSRAQSLYSFAGIFDEVTQKTGVSGQQLINNLRSQNDALKGFSETMESLRSRGLDGALLDELSALGPKSLGELEALNSLSDDQLSEYVALWKEKSTNATVIAEQQLVDTRAKADEQIALLREETADQLEKYEKEWLNAIESVSNGTTRELKQLANDMPSIGASVITGLQSGLSQMTPSLIAQAQAIADAIKSTISSALDINSPSRVMRGFGVNIGEGLVLGMDDMIDKVAQTSQRLSDAASNALGSLASSSAKSQAYGANSSTSSSVDNSRHFNPSIVIHTNDSGSRAMDRTLRRLALKFN